MRKTELEACPGWLMDAKTGDENVEWDSKKHTYIIWYGGIWYGGKWHGGVWIDGEWRGGEWHGGIWYGGKWRGQEDRLLYMCALLGIVFDADGNATAYRSTYRNGMGRHNGRFKQTSGRFDVKHELAGKGTCVEGLHVSSAAIAYTYFGVDPTAKLWKVRFNREDLLDCDGEKARLRGGWCEELAWPFLPKKT